MLFIQDSDYSGYLAGDKKATERDSRAFDGLHGHWEEWSLLLGQGSYSPVEEVDHLCVCMFGKYDPDMYTHA